MKETTGTPIAFQIINEDHNRKIIATFKISIDPHMQIMFTKKNMVTEIIVRWSISARETACRVVAGAIAQLLLKLEGVEIHLYVQQVGKIVIEQPYQELDLSQDFFANKVGAQMSSWLKNDC